MGNPQGHLGAVGHWQEQMPIHIAHHRFGAPSTWRPSSGQCIAVYASEESRATHGPLPPKLMVSTCVGQLRRERRLFLVVMAIKLPCRMPQLKLRFSTT